MSSRRRTGRVEVLNATQPSRGMHARRRIRARPGVGAATLTSACYPRHDPPQVSLHSFITSELEILLRRPPGGAHCRMRIAHQRRRSAAREARRSCCARTAAAVHPLERSSFNGRHRLVWMSSLGAGSGGLRRLVRPGVPDRPGKPEWASVSERRPSRLHRSETRLRKEIDRRCR